MSLIKYGLPNPKQACKTCYKPINILRNKRIQCSDCNSSICANCSHDYDGQLHCESCYNEIMKGSC